MIDLIKEIFGQLTPRQRKRFFKLQILVILMALTEIAGVASFGPFMALVGDIDILQGDSLLADTFQLSGFVNANDFLILVGIGVLTVLAFSAVLSMYTVWKLAHFSSKLGAEISSQLYSYYMGRSWIYHTSVSSAQLTKNISAEAGRVTDGIIAPLMQVNGRLVLAFFMSIAIFIFNPIVALTGLTIFGLGYFILFKTVRRRLVRNGRVISEVSTIRFKLLSEGFGGIKDVLLLGRKSNFVDQFQDCSDKYAYSRGDNSALATVPRYFMEFLAFAVIILLVIYIVRAYESNMGVIMPVLSVYALAGLKLLPAFQQIYNGLAVVKANVFAFDSIKADLKCSRSIVVQGEASRIKKKDSDMKKWGEDQFLHLNQAVTFKDVTFTYPGKNEPVLDQLNMTIPVNKLVGIVGASGSGKSTAIDLLLGLIQPDQGQLMVDEHVITQKNVRAWQNTMGFVAQTIFLTDASIAENIAFGVPRDIIDNEKVMRAIKVSHLDELVKDLPEGLDTRVGERGVQLSGGQRQRIGIARSLYGDADILIFDEATSALDVITEKMIMNAIHEFSGEKTIVMIAHRLSTVKKCDIIYLMESGRVIDSGDYDELMKKNPTFRNMVSHDK